MFVSHASQDAKRVKPLVDALKAANLKVWIDADTIKSHESITETVSDGVARSKVLLAYYSEAYPSRRACQWELTTAFLAAQRAGEDPRERVLVINPERNENGDPRTDHLQPVQLRDALFVIAHGDEDAVTWTAEAQRIAEIVARHTCALGEGPQTLPRQVPQRLVGSPGFVGRISDLWEIHSALSAGDTALITGAAGGDVAQLAGMGGVGKSLLAEEYALRFGGAYPGGIFWLRGTDARDPRAPEQDTTSQRNRQFRDIAANLGIAIEERSYEQLRGEIARELEQAGRCLWVVDDLPAGESFEEVRSWLAPHPSAKTLITTRSRTYQMGGRVDLACLPTEDGLQLLCRWRSPADEHERREAVGIVEDLGGHPLALSVTAHALRAGDEKKPFATYRKALAEKTDDELEFAATLAPELPTDHERSIATTLLRSIRALQAPGLDLLRVASLLAPTPLPRAMLKEIFALALDLGEPDAHRTTTSAVAETEGLSLAEPGDPERETFNVHTLVARTVRFKDDSLPRIEQLREAAIATLANHLKNAEDVRQHRDLAALIPHARTLAHDAIQPEERRRGPILLLCEAVATYDYQRGDYRAALPLERAALEFINIHPGENSPLGAGVKKKLARTLRELGELEEACELYEQVVEWRQQAFDYDDPETLEAMHELAVTVKLRGGDPKAHDKHTEILERQVQALEEDDLDALSAMHDLAYSRIDEDAAAAVATARDVLARYEGRPDHNQSEALRMKNNLAAMLTHTGELDEARSLFQEVVRACQLLLSEKHADTLTAMNNLAGVMGQQGERRAALEIMEDVATGRKEALGYGHADTQSAIDGVVGLLKPEEPQFVIDDESGVAIGFVGCFHEKTKRATFLRAHGSMESGPQVPAPASRARSKQGRNEQCACGSGKKFKRCCGA